MGSKGKLNNNNNNNNDDDDDDDDDDNNNNNNFINVSRDVAEGRSPLY